MAIPLQVNPIQIQPIQGAGQITGIGGSTPPTPTPTPSPAATPNAAGFIQQAQSQGIPDEQIFNTLHQQGMIPTNAIVTQGQQGQGAQLQDTGSFGGNLANSFGNFLSGIGNAIMHPLDTASTLSKTFAGIENQAFDKIGLTTDTGLGDFLQNRLVKYTTLSKDATPEKTKSLAQNVEGFFKERYGGVENIKTTIYQDPVGFLADVATLFDGAAGALGKAGDVSKIGELSKAGTVVGKIGDTINPLNAVTKPVEFTAKLGGAGLGKLQSILEKSNLRLTPVQKTEYAAKLGDVVDYIGKNIKTGSPETRYEHAAANVDKFETQIQNYLENDAAHVTVGKQTLLDGAEAIKKEFVNDRDSLAINKQIDDFKSTIETNYKDSMDTFNADGSPMADIAVSDVNQLKRSTFKNAFNKTGTKVSDAVEFKLGDMLKTVIEDATKDVPVMGKYPIGDVNKAYGIALNAKKLLKVAMGRPQLGFVERLLADALGFGTHGPFGAVGAHAAANYLPVTAIKSVIGKTASKAGKVIPKIKLPAGGLQGVTSASRVNTAAK